MTKKNFEEKNDSKSTVSKVVKGSYPATIRSKVFKIKVYIGIAISLLVVAILACIFLFSSNKAKKESSPASSVTSTKESTSQTSTSQGKTDETDKDKQVEIKKLKDQLASLDSKIAESEALVGKLKKEEEIQKLKDQLVTLDTKISESETLVGKLKKETAVPKLDFEALRNNDLSSLEGTWLTPSGNQYIINNSGEVRSTWLSNGEKQESIVQLSGARKLNENPETVIIGAGVKDSLVGGFVVLAVPSGVVLQPSDDGKFTDKSNHSEERLLGGQGYNAMLMHPEDVYYRVKPDTSKLEAEEKNLENLKAERETIKTKLETKEQKNTSE